MADPEDHSHLARSLEGVRVLVTGASSGIGAAIATALCGHGASVALAARPNGRLHDVVARLRAGGSRAWSVALDVRDPPSVTLAVRATLLALGGVDVVVNNAGIGMRTVDERFFERAQPFFEVLPAQFAEVVATNLTGYFLVARAFTPCFLQQGRGRFVNVSVNRETMVRRGFAPYGPSRAGSEALSMVMAEDLRPYGIAVNVLAPGGPTDTGMIPAAVPDAVRRRLLPPEVMGPPAVFLCSPEADGLTGARLVATEFDTWLAAYVADRSGAADR